MRPATVEERLRDYIAAEREQVAVPPRLADRILRGIESSEPIARHRSLSILGTMTAAAAILLLGLGVVAIRMTHSPAGGVMGRWSSAQSMAEARASDTATLLPNGKVLVVGGSQTVRALASAELYDPTTGRWSSAGQLDAARWGHTATLLPNGKVLVAGGTPADGISIGSLASVELYDSKTNSWSAAAPMLTPRSLHTATLLPDGLVLVAGGVDAFNDVSGKTLASTELYDPASNTWTAGPPMNTPRFQQVAIALADHRVLVLGGTAGFGLGEAAAAWRTSELYDPATESWSNAGNMHYARVLPNVSLLPDGRVLVVGDAGSNFRTAELFDPTTERWSLAPDPGTSRAEAAATQLPGGNVLVAGGLGETSAQVFDWRRNRWSNAGNIATIRANATATLLPNGQVLVAGGFGQFAAPWSSAELYDPTGVSTQAVPRNLSAPLQMENAVPLLAIAGLVLGISLWLVRRRQAEDRWLDPENR